jgi:hypothetical protein
VVLKRCQEPFASILAVARIRPSLVRSPQPVARVPDTFQATAIALAG